MISKTRCGENIESTYQRSVRERDWHALWDELFNNEYGSTACAMPPQVALISGLLIHDICEGDSIQISKKVIYKNPHTRVDLVQILGLIQEMR